MDCTWAASPRTQRLLVGVMTSMVGGVIARPLPTSTVVSIMTRSGIRISDAFAWRIAIIRLTGDGGSSCLASDKERSKAWTDFVEPITSNTPATESTETSGLASSPSASTLACRSNAAIARPSRMVASLVSMGITRYVTSPGCGRSRVVNSMSMVTNWSGVAVTTRRPSASTASNVGGVNGLPSRGFNMDFERVDIELTKRLGAVEFTVNCRTIVLASTVASAAASDFSKESSASLVPSITNRREGRSKSDCTSSRGSPAVAVSNIRVARATAMAGSTASTMR